MEKSALASEEMSLRKEQDNLSGLSHICEVEESRLWSMAFPVVNLNKIRRLNTVKGFGQVISTIALTNNQAKLLLT